MIEVTHEPERRLVRARMGGMLTPADVAAFSRDEQAAVRAMRCRGGDFDLLIETRGDVVQTQDVMDAFSRLLVDTPLKARRIATVRAGALARMQSRRMSKVRTDNETFETVNEAMAWLALP